MKQSIPNLFSPTLLVKSNAQVKIQELCNIIPFNEWSGILFYKVKGIIGKEETTIEALDIFLMDEGTETFTSFEANHDVATYMVENPELMEEGVYQGIIHSHHNMGAFLSGTDLATLIDFGKSQVHCLSVVVDNRGKVVAKITYKVSMGVSKYLCSILTFNDKEVTKWKEEGEPKWVVKDLDVITSPIPMNQNPLFERINYIRGNKKTFPASSTSFPRPKIDYSLNSLECEELGFSHYNNKSIASYVPTTSKSINRFPGNTLPEDKVIAMFTSGGIGENKKINLSGAERLYSKCPYGFWAGVYLLNFLISNEFLELFCSENKVKDPDTFAGKVLSKLSTLIIDITKYPTLNSIVDWVLAQE